MTTEAQAQVVTHVRSSHLVITVRACYADGVVHYYDVGGASNGEDAVQLARQQAELDRPGVALYTAACAAVNEREQEA